jgi:hypothetical protein
MKKIKWEYLVVTVQKFLDDMMEIGIDGWELSAVCNDLVYFKRPLEEEDIPGPRKEVDILLADLSKRNDPISNRAANFIRHTLGIANTIKNTGWNFESGHDLIEDIFCPSFLDPESKR